MAEHVPMQVDSAETHASPAKSSQISISERVSKFFSQLKDGCGTVCSHPFCGGNPAFKRFELGPNHYAVLSAQLALKAPNFLVAPSSVAKVHSFLDIVDLKKSVAECEANNNLTQLIRTLGSVFSTPEFLANSFWKNPMLVSLDGSDIGLNIDEMKEAFEIIQSLPESCQSAASSAMERVVGELRLLAPKISSPFEMRPFLILLESPHLQDIGNHTSIMGPLLVAISRLPSKMLQLIRSNYVETFSKERFQQMLSLIQDFIALRALDAGEGFNPHRDPFVSAAVVFMGLLHDHNKIKNWVKYDAFYSETINENLRADDDFVHWKKPARGFSYCNYSFVLSAETKSFILRIESEVKQYREREEAISMMMMTGVPIVPYVVLRVFRQNLIHSSLEQLAQQPSSNLKKQLKIQFVGEEGIDEGGVQKEWFQLLVKQIFSPAFGMFTEDTENRLHWFNGHSTDFSEFELIGKLLGLAIYNSNILDLHFPQVVYKKLVGIKPSLEDLSQTHPTLAKGLRQILDCEGNVEELFGLNYSIVFDYFGAQETHELIANGSAVPVTNANREDYVTRYVKYLLEDSVERQFSAFMRGFQLVCSDSEAILMFSPEELEQVICGSPKLDFYELEKSTQYDGGFDENSETIKDFWSIVHSFSDEQKRKLLMFATGSDRAPIGGLKQLGFVINRGGSGDTDRLPTSHTCFNVLILHEYSSKEKLRRLLLKALEHAEGFGNL